MNRSTAHPPQNTQTGTRFLSLLRSAPSYITRKAGCWLGLTGWGYDGGDDDDDDDVDSIGS